MRIRSGARLEKVPAICLVLRTFSLSGIGIRSTVGRPCRAKVRWPSSPEDVEASEVGVAQCRDDGVPPALGEVLPLVDDDLVKPFGFGHRLGERHHLYREDLLPVRLSSSDPGRTPQPMPRLWNVPT